MNKEEIKSKLESAIGVFDSESVKFFDMGDMKGLNLDDFIEKLYISDEMSHVRVDLFRMDDGSGYLFRVSGFDPDFDDILLGRGIANMFFLGEK